MPSHTHRTLTSHITLRPTVLLKLVTCVLKLAVYRVGEGDTLLSVAARFRTTIKSLLLLNPDVDVDGLLQQKQELCLIPCAA